MRRYFCWRAIVEYLTSSGWGWWLFITAVSTLWGVAAWLLPDVHWLQTVPSWVLLGTPGLALLIGPYIAYQKKWHEAESLKASRRPFAAVSRRVQSVLDDELHIAGRSFKKRLSATGDRFALTNNRFSSSFVLAVRAEGTDDIRRRAELIAGHWADAAGACVEVERFHSALDLATERLRNERLLIEEEVERHTRSVKMERDPDFLEQQFQLSRNRLTEEIRGAWERYNQAQTNSSNG